MSTRAARRSSAGRRTWRMQRVASIDPNPRTFEQRSTTFAASIPDGGSVTLLVSRTESGGVVSQLSGPARMGDSGALALAQAVGAKAVPVTSAASIPSAAADLVDTGGGLLLPRVAVLGWAERDPEAPVAHSVQAGANPAEVARLLAGSLQPGQWVAVVIRTPRNSERRLWRRWLTYRLGTANPVHHSLGPRPLVVSMLAGGRAVDDVVSLLDQMAASLPGFDIGIRVRAGRLPWVRLGGPAPIVGAAAAALGAVLLHAVRDRLGAALAGWPAAAGESLLPRSAPLLAVLPVVVPAGLLAVALLLGLGSLYRLTGRGSSWPVQVARAAEGRFPRPRRLRARPRPPRAEQPPDTDGRGGRRGFEGDYPLHRAAFLVGPAVVAAVVAPQGGAVSGGAETRDRGVPPVLLSDIGPVLGTATAGRDPAGQPVHISAFDAGFGVAITGSPGTGKTKLLEGLWLADTLDRVRPSGRPGWPGRRNTLITFDTKGEEVPVLQRWATLAGDHLSVVSVNDPATWAVDMFGLDPDPVRSAAMFVDAMVYAFEAGSIMARSQETLTAVFAGALAADDQVCSLVPGLGPVRHPVRLAHLLCGGAGEATARDLFGALRSEASRRADPVMLAAVEKLNVLYEPFTSSAFRNATEAARNKIDALLKLRSWWDSGRRRVTWDQIITRHLSVVVDTGSGGAGRPGAGASDERSGNLLAGMLMFGLWTALKRNCAGWRDQDRWVSVYSDELAVQAATSAEPIGWMRDQGRSSGVRLRLATQRTEQLPPPVRDVFLTFPNLVSYRQESVAAARSVAENVTQGEDVFTADDIRNLPPFTAVVRLDVNRRLVPSFVCAVHDFEADPLASIELLGFTPARSAAGHPGTAVGAGPGTGSDPAAGIGSVEAPLGSASPRLRPVTVFDDDTEVEL